MARKFENVKRLVDMLGNDIKDEYRNGNK